jgi:hypothetical protein
MSITRRLFLRHTAVAGVAGSLAPTVATAEPAAAPNVQDFLDRASPAERARYHAMALADAMHEMRPGLYVLRIDHELGLAIIADRSGRKGRI